ncbi:MAG TPA: gliding motility-associated C-terminal domain-containing protein [Bacteroidales bacterium]|nr:gliding motility-associated C-terminal domain-containing protein [Bacteroidales bacterium]
MKKLWSPALLIIMLLGMFVSCKKQDVQPSETLYDTLKVNTAYSVYTMGENTVLTLDATAPGAVAYLWMPDYINTPMITITQEGNYSVKVTTHDNEFDYTVLVLFSGSDCYIPNSFSPNNDGVNDYWHPFFANISSENFLLNIYDNKNLKLFSSTNVDAKWDGYHNGALMPAGYYYYVLSYQTIDGETKNRNGMIQLIL